MSYPLYFTNFFQYAGGNFVAESPLKEAIQISYPKEFHGNPRFWTPSELLLAALNSSLVLGFLKIMENHKIHIRGVESTASCKIINKEGIVEIDYIKISLKIKPDSIYNLSRIEEVLEGVLDITPELKLVKEKVQLEYAFK